MSVDTNVEAVSGVLRERGVQATSARTAVLQLLLPAEHHHTVQELRAGILARYLTVDPATIYRTPETLFDHGPVVRMELGDKLPSGRRRQTSMDTSSAETAGR